MPVTEAEDAAWELSSDAWLPMPSRPKEVLDAIRAEDTFLCAGRIGPTGQLEQNNVVERLATAFGILRTQQSRTGRTPMTTTMWESIESLGSEVSPEYAECGNDAVTVIEVADRLLDGHPMDTFAMSRAFSSLGRLWQCAFSAPSGMDLWMANSASLIARPESRFFPRLPETLPGDPAELGQYLCGHIDLLQAAVATNDLPERKIERPISVGQWRGLVGRVRVPGGDQKRMMDVHRRVEPLAHNVDRISVKLVDRDSGAALAAARMIRLRGETGQHQELVALSDVAGELPKKVMEATFGSDDLVGLWPRVRRLMNDLDQLVYEIGIIEGMHVTPYWRQRGLSRVLFRQAMADSLDLSLLLSQVDPVGSILAKPLTTGIEAGYCAGRLRLARSFATIGGQYLVNGVMGMSAFEIYQQGHIGLSERETR